MQEETWKDLWHKRSHAKGLFILYHESDGPDTLDSGTSARNRACGFFCIFSIVLLSRNVPCDFWRLARNVPSRSCNRDTRGGVRNVLRLGALGVHPRIAGERIARTFFNKTRWVQIFRTHARLVSSQFSCLASMPLFFCGRIPSCHVWAANGKTSGSLLVSRLSRPTWRNGYTQAMILPTNKDLRIFLRLCRAQATKATSPTQNYVMMHLQHLDQRSSLPPLRPRCNFIHPRQLSPFPERLKLAFQVKRSCQASKKVSPRAQTSTSRG